MLIEKALIIRRLSNQVSIEYAKLCADSCETFGLDYEYAVAVENLSCDEAFEKTGLVATQSYKNEIKGIRGHCCTTCSHYNCWKRIVELNKTCVVLEHDAVILGDIKTIDIPHDSVVTFGNIIDSPMNYEPTGPAARLEPIGSAKGAHAYALTPRTAQYLIEDAQKNGVKTAVDRWLMRGFDDVPHCELPLYMCDPPQVVSWARISTIQSDRFNKERMTSLMNFDPSLTNSWQAGLKKKIQNAIIVYDAKNSKDIENSVKCAKNCIDNNIPYEHLPLDASKIEVPGSYRGTQKIVDRFKRHFAAWKEVIKSNQTSMIIEPECILFDDVSDIMIPNDSVVMLFKYFASQSQFRSHTKEKYLREIDRYMTMFCYAITPDTAKELVRIVMKHGITSRLENLFTDNKFKMYVADPVPCGIVSNQKNIEPYKSAQRISCQKFEDIYDYLEYLKTGKVTKKKPQKQVETAIVQQKKSQVCRTCFEKDSEIERLKQQIDNLNSMIMNMLSRKQKKIQDNFFYGYHHITKKVIEPLPEPEPIPDIAPVLEIVEELETNNEDNTESVDNTPTFKTNLSRLRLSLRGEL